MPLLLLLACVGDKGNTDEPFRGLVTFTVEGGAAVSEPVELAFLGWSEVAGDGFAMLTATDEDFVYELMFVLEGVTGPGDYTPTRMRYRKGLQALLDAEASCTVSLFDATTGPAPYTGEFTCEGLHTEEGLAAGDEAPWALSVGSFSGGAFTALGSRAERLSGPGYTFDVELSQGGETVTQNDPARALVVPWRGDESWVVFEAGDDDSLDDLTLRLIPTGAGLEMRRWTRQDLLAETAVDLHFLAEEPGVAASVEGGSVSGEGTDFRLRLWDDALEGEDQIQVNVR